MRYVAGCAGQFVLNQPHGEFDDVDEAIASCADGPVGCEVYDRETKRWIGPSCGDEIEAAKSRLAVKAESQR